MQDVPHYFIDNISINDTYNVGQFERDAIDCIETLFKTHEQLILVGGSGLFIDALCIGLDKIPFNQEVRDKLNVELEQFGLARLLEELALNDPDYYQQVDRSNATRVIRALEVIRNTKNTFSSYLEADTKSTRTFESHYFVINHPREILYQRIEKRVDLMLESGLLEEVKSVKHLEHLQTLNTVGYSELFNYLSGDISYERAVELIKQNTRRYAKRQLTWFRRYPSAHWLVATQLDLQVEEVLTNLK